MAFCQPYQVLMCHHPAALLLCSAHRAVILSANTGNFSSVVSPGVATRGDQGCVHKTPWTWWNHLEVTAECGQQIPEGFSLLDIERRCWDSEGPVAMGAAWGQAHLEPGAGAGEPPGGWRRCQHHTRWHQGRRDHLSGRWHHHAKCHHDGG